MRKNKQKGFTVVEVVAIVLVLVLLGGVAYYVYQRTAKDKTTANSNESSLAAKETFFACVENDGTTSEQGPVTCSREGATHSFPSAFTTDAILRYDKVPAAARQLVVDDARKNFEGCLQLAATGDPYTAYPLTTVDLVAGNFVTVGVQNCDNGHYKDYAFDGASWSYLGSRQTNISCDTVTKYDIRQSNVVGGDKAAFERCESSTGDSPIPE